MYLLLCVSFAYVCLYCCVTLCVHGGWKTTYESQFSPSTLWIPWIELRSSGVEASVFTLWAVWSASPGLKVWRDSPPPCCYLVWFITQDLQCKLLILDEMVCLFFSLSIFVFKNSFYRCLKSFFIKIFIWAYYLADFSAYWDFAF